MKNNAFNRNQLMMTTLDEMISEDSKVRVIDAYAHSLDVEQLGYQVTQTKLDVFKPQITRVQPPRGTEPSTTSLKRCEGVYSTV